MGVVYKAQDTRLNRTVVLKALRKDQTGDPVRERRFLQEARAASALNHPNIITIHDLVTAGGRVFIVMEYVAGQPLDFLIPSGGLAPEAAIAYAAQIADALSAAHSLGIIHRDLKPANIMVTPSGRIKLLDFGLAKLTRNADSGVLALTTEGSIIGTVCYMSPEQAGGGALDGRSDIFSFGALLYEMVNGRRAFDQRSPGTTLSAVLRLMPPAPEGLPTGLSELIMRCLEKDPAKRFQTASEVRTALLQIAAVQPRADSPGTGDSAPDDAGKLSLTETALRRDREYYEQAVHSEHSQASIWAGMAEYYATGTLLGLRDPGEAAPKAIWAASKAIGIEEESESAHVTLGLIRANYDLRWEQARPLVDRARSRHQKLRRALFYLKPAGCFQEAEVDAVGEPSTLAWIALEKGDLAVADRCAAQAELESWIGCWVRAWTLLARGRTREAIETCYAAEAIEPLNPLIESALAVALTMHKQTEAARRLIERPVWRPASFPVAWLIAAGSVDRAFDVARTALQRRDPGLITILRLPVLRPYRAEPRYRELLTALGL